MDREIAEALQKISDQNAEFHAHVATEIVDIKAMLHVLLDFQEARLIQEGEPMEAAHKTIEAKLSEHQNAFLADALSSDRGSDNEA